MDPLRAPAERLAALAAAVGAHDWAAAAGGPPAQPCPVPSYGTLTAAALDLVEPLAAAGRWDEAAGHAVHLARYLDDPRAPLDPIGRHAVGAVAAAARARDPEALADFAELLRDVLGPGA